MASLFWSFLDHTQPRTTVGRTNLDEWLARRRDLYLTKHNAHNRQTRMPTSGIRTHNLIRLAATDLRLRTRSENNVYEIVQPICESRLLNKACVLVITSRGLFSSSKCNIRLVILIESCHKKCSTKGVNFFHVREFDFLFDYFKS